MKAETVSFGQWVRQQRRALDFTQAELAQRVGCAAITIRKIERDERRPSPQMAELLVEHLAIPGPEREAFLRLARGQFIAGGSQLRRSDGLPAFLDPSTDPAVAREDIFVAREIELKQLNSWLTVTLAGSGRIGFVTGEAGRGKTSLLAEFARRAQEEQKNLIVAGGICNAFSGSGDPYLPFRDILRMLIGDVEAGWAGGAISREQAVRLWRLAPYTLQTLLSDGQALIDVFIPELILARIAAAHPNSPGNWREELNRIRQERVRRRDIEQQQLFEQFFELLFKLAARQPLLLLLDDLQWADSASLNLLFHLGRRLPESRILIAGAYRPSEVALGRLETGDKDDQRHPLEPVIFEFKRHYGEIELDLGRFLPEAGMAFVEALIDSEPNRFDADFRQALFWRTKGHPLFTSELLRALQEQGDLFKDGEGRWQTSPSLRWDSMPARVEAVIAQRVGRLDNTLREVLTVASVEGEIFTAQVVAQVLQRGELPLLRSLAQELENRHRLVHERDEIEIGEQFLNHFQFRHALFQQYLYNALSPGERRLLHRDVARALESLYGAEQAAIVVQLAYHYRQGGEREKALAFTRQAARQAEAMYAFDEAVEYVHAALSLIRPGDQRELRLALLEQLADLHVSLGERPEAIAIYQEAIGLQGSLLGENRVTLTRLHRKIGMTVAHMTWYEDRQEHELLAREHLQLGLDLVAGRPPHIETVRLLVAVAEESWFSRVQPDWDRSEYYANLAIEMAETLDTPVELSAALNTLAAVYGARGLFRERLQVSLRRLALSRDPRFDDVREQASILTQTGRALTLVGEYSEAIPYLQEAEDLSQRIQALDLLFYALRYQAVCYYRLDQWDAVLGIEDQWRGMAERYTNFEERAGPTCFFIALVASIHALRGRMEQARQLRGESVAVMVANDGPMEGWGRDNHY